MENSDTLKTPNFSQFHEKYYTVREIAEMWRCNIETVRRLIRSDKLKAFRAGPGNKATYMVSEIELKRYMNRTK